MNKKLEEYKKVIQSITVIFTAVSFLWLCFNTYTNVFKMLEKTQQMSLKAIIWNSQIPNSERIEMCDEYLDLGFNSYTKKHCENILNNESVVY